MKKIRLTYPVFFLFFIVFFSCSKKSQAVEISSEAGTKAEKHITIGYSIDTLAIERWRRDSDVFLNIAKEAGAEVIVQNAGNKVDVQINQLEYLIKRGVDVLVIVPKKADSLGDVIKNARNHGIPVISYDRLILNADISLYMTIDSFKVGKLMAENLFSVCPYGNWYCFYGPEEDYNMTLIKNGIKSVISGSPVNIGYIFHADGWNYDLSYEKTLQILKEGKMPDAFIAGNDAIAGSIIRAFTEYRVRKNVPIAGQDADISACQNILSGKQYVTVYKPINVLAKKAALAAIELAHGKTAAEITGRKDTIDNGFAEIPVIWLEPVAVTKKNLDEVIIKSGFHTSNEIYRN